MAHLKFEVYVPASHVADIVAALQGAGLLREGNYDHCYALTAVRGFFRPLAEATAYLGEVGEITEVAEVKLEGRIPQSAYQQAVALIKAHHPYEVPVINFIQLFEENTGLD